jgi:hypothetical protein
VREIRTLRAKRRGLETESRTTLIGHERGNPGHGQGKTYHHRASPRPYRVRRTRRTALISKMAPRTDVSKRTHLG